MKIRILTAFFLLVYSFCAKAQSNTPPNIVLILVDDSGLMDFGAFGGEAHTPNIDQLAKQGMMFTNFHTSPVCAPSRAMLLTGSDSHLTGVANLPEMMPEGYENEPGYAGVLNDRVLTVATRLKKAGYKTYASGKWHLGYDEKTLPSVRGFDRSFIFGGSGAHNYKAKGYLPMKETAEWFADGKKVGLPEDFYSSKDYIKQAIRFHEEEQDKTAPFFSYIAFQAIHAPLQAPESFVRPYLKTYKEGWDVLRQKRFETAKEMGFIPQNASINGMFPSFKKWNEITKAEQDAYITDMAVLAAMLEAMDYYIGQYVDYLKEKGLYENTIFIVASDNGPDGADYHSSALARSWQKGQGYHRDISRYGDPDYYGAIGPEFAHALASPFSFFKYYTGEGGVRTPLIISGKEIPKARKSDVFCFITDIVPTILEVADIDLNPQESEVQITGKSIYPHIQNPELKVYTDQEGVGLEAANNASYYLGDFKIVKNNIPLGDNQWYMYNLKTDPGETKNISQDFPEKFEQMKAAYYKYAKAVGVVEMEEGYSAEREVAIKSVKKLFYKNIYWILGLSILLIGLIIWLFYRIFRRRSTPK